MEQRNFYNELKDAVYKPLPYSLYNKLDDSGFIIQLKGEFNEVFSIDDFECYKFNLNEDEKFFLENKGKKMMASIAELIDKFKDVSKIKICVDGKSIIFIKTKDIDINLI